MFHLALDGPIGVHATTHDKPAASLASHKGKYHAERVTITWLCGPGLAGCALIVGCASTPRPYGPVQEGSGEPAANHASAD